MPIGLKDALEGLTGETTIGGNVIVSEKLTSDLYYGQLYTDTGISKVTDGIGTYVTITGLTTNGNNNVVLTDSTMIIGASAGGLYNIRFFANSVTHTTNATIIHISLFVNGVEESMVEGERKIAAGGDLGSFSAGGDITLLDSAVVELKVKADKAGTFSAGHFTFVIDRIN